MNDAIHTDALALHRGLLTIDTHIDIPWPTGPDPFQNGTRRVDLPKMQRGGLAAGCFAAYVPQAARTPESDVLSEDLQKRGFRFVGSTICYALMQATGMVNDHTLDCFRYASLSSHAS